MYRFHSVDISNTGPFDGGQSIILSDDLTVVAAGNGLGKTTIAKALRRSFDMSNHHVIEAGGFAITSSTSWLVFFGEEDLNLPYGGEAWVPLANLFSISPILAERRQEFECLITTLVQEALGSKVSGLSKFSGLLKSSKQIYTSVTPNGAVDIRDRQSNEKLNDCFRAVGERIVLYLAIVYATRKVLSIDLPFVVDSMLGMLDELLRAPCAQLMTVMSGQVVILDQGRTLDDLNIEIDFRIIPDPVSGKSIIESSV